MLDAGLSLQSVMRGCRAGDFDCTAPILTLQRWMSDRAQNEFAEQWARVQPAKVNAQNCSH